MKWADMKFKDLNQEEFAVNVAGGFSDSKLAKLYGVSGRTILRWRTRLGLASTWEPDLAECGTAAAYVRGCRCADCRAANTVRHREAVTRMRDSGLPADDARHGTYTAYTQWGCRCAPCVEAGRLKNRASYVKRHGEPSRTVRPWTEFEDFIVRSCRPKDAARETGRTLTAVYQRRKVLAITRSRA